MKLILIRHGETKANVLYNTVDACLIGALENELTQLNETGIAQAEHARQELQGVHVDEIICSPLKRAMDTAKIIFGNVPLHIDERIKERSHGHYEGMRWIDLQDDEQFTQSRFEPNRDSLEVCLNSKTISGESYQDVFTRVRDFLSDLDFNEEKRIAIVSHYHVLRVLKTLLEKKEITAELFKMPIENAKPMYYIKDNNRFLQVDHF